VALNSFQQGQEFEGSLKPLFIDDAKLMLSKICTIIADYVALNFVAEQVNIATI